MKNEIIIQSLSLHSIVAIPHEVELHPELRQKTVGTLGVPTNYYPVKRNAYIFEASAKKNVLLYTRPENRTLRSLVARVADVYGYRSCLIDHLDAVGTVAGDIILLDTKHLNPWGARHLAALCRDGQTKGKHFIFTEAVPEMGKLPYNHLPDSVESHQPYLEDSFNYMENVALLTKELLPHFPEVFQRMKSAFTGRDFVDVFRFTKPAAYNRVFDELDCHLQALVRFNEGKFHFDYPDLITRAMLAQLFTFDQHLQCLDSRLTGASGLALRPLTDLTAVAWRNLESAS